MQFPDEHCGWRVKEVQAPVFGDRHAPVHDVQTEFRQHARLVYEIQPLSFEHVGLMHVPDEHF